MKLLNQDPAAKTADQGVQITLTRNRLLAIAFLIVAVPFLIWMRVQEPASARAFKDHSPNTASTTLTADTSQRAFRGAPGPWGNIEYVRIHIERPDEFIVVETGPIPDSRWFFEGMNEAQVQALFTAAEVAAEQRSALLDRSHWQTATNGLYVTPGTKLILSLGLAARQKIYSVLAESPLNSFQHVPFTFRAEGFDEWFSQSGISTNSFNLVKQLVYRRGPSICFSDLPEIFSVTPALDERRRLLKTLSRHSTLLAKLRVNADSNVEEMVKYWGRAGRSKDIRPLLESLTKVPGGTTLDMAHLMSPFARMRLYTYPAPSTDPGATHRDCFWTTMNYFNVLPDDRFFEFENTRKAIATQYDPVSDHPVYGDIIFIYNAKGTIVHAATYLADDVVFTKNGAYFNEPWVLMKMDDMMSEYPTDTPYKIAVFRPKNS